MKDAERSYAKEAFSAMKEGDEEGFTEAFLSAVRACVKKAKTGDYGDAKEPDADDEE